MIRLLPFLLLAGCIQVGPKELPDFSKSEETPKRIRVVCPSYQLPPIEKTVHISIEPGKPAKVDEGGEKLIRSYVNAIDYYKAQH